MKRFFSVKLKTAILCLILSLTALLSACSPAPSVRFPTSPFECDLCWSFNGYDFTASFASHGSFAELNITSPYCLSGSRLCMDGGSLSYFYKDMRFDSVPEYYVAVVNLLFGSSGFDYLCQANIEGADALCYSRGEARWYFDAQSKLPIRAEQGDISLKIFNVKE